MTDIARPLDGTRGFVERFREVVKRIPHRIALSDLETQTSFAELATAASETAAAIAAEAPPHGPALIAEDGLHEMVTAYVGALLSGRTAVVRPAHLPIAGWADYAERVGATVIVGPGRDPHIQRVPVVVSIPQGRRTAGRPDERLAAASAATPEWSDVVLLAGTSGSTGEPSLIARRSPIGWGQSFPPLDALETALCRAANLSASPLLLLRMSAALLAGSRFVGFRLDRFPPGELIRRLAEEDITDFHVAPSVIRRLHLAARGRGRLIGVERVQCVGEPLYWTDVTAIRELCGPDVTVMNHYGATEVGRATCRTIHPDESVASGPVDVGTPHTGRHVWVVRDDGEPAAVDETGRVVIEGRFDAEGFPTEDVGDGVGRFVTGDLGRIDPSGALWIEGRADRMVKVAGVRIESGAVEDVLRGVTDVLEAAVLPVAIGGGEVRLVAHVVVGEHGPDADTLRRATAAQIPAVAVPVRFHLRRDPLPLLASGKVDVRALMDGDA